MGFWLQEGKVGFLLATVVFPRLSPPLPALHLLSKAGSPTQGHSRAPVKEAAGQEAAFLKDGGFLRKRMQMREERELLIHIMSVELSMTN